MGNASNASSQQIMSVVFRKENWTFCVVYWGSVYYYRVRTEDWQVLYTTALLDWIIQSYLQWYIVV